MEEKRAESLGAQTSPPSRVELIREAWIAAAGIVILLGVVKHVGAVVPFIGRHQFTIAAAAQLYVPVFLIGRRGITKRSLGLTLSKWKEDLLLVFVLAVMVTVPYAIGHHLYQTELFQHPFRFRLPKDLLTAVLTQVFVVALAEEIFFRGYLQERLTRIWPPAKKLFGVPFGWAILVTSLVFALGHVIGEYRIDRFGPFFPGLVFGMLRARTGTIVGSILFHAYCNVLGEVLWASYRPGP